MPDGSWSRVGRGGLVHFVSRFCLFALFVAMTSNRNRSHKQMSKDTVRECKLNKLMWRGNKWHGNKLNVSTLQQECSTMQLSEDSARTDDDGQAGRNDSQMTILYSGTHRALYTKENSLSCEQELRYIRGRI
jgi:hypothetical protein